MTLDNIHKIAAPYWARPGFVSFAKADDGGGKDDDRDDDEEDDEDDDEEGDDLADLSDDELREELKKTRESLSKASGSSKVKRDRIKKLKEELAEANSKKPAAKKDGDDDAPDLDQVRAAAKAEARAESDTRIKKAEARGALASAGVAKERVARAVGLLDLGAVDVDDDGEVDGLDDAIDALKREWPELFPAERKRRGSVAGDDDRDGSAGRRGKGKPSTDELQAAALLGRNVRR